MVSKYNYLIVNTIKVKYIQQNKEKKKIEDRAKNNQYIQKNKLYN